MHSDLYVHRDLVRRAQGKNNLEDRGLDGRVILKRFLNKSVGTV